MSRLIIEKATYQYWSITMHRRTWKLFVVASLLASPCLTGCNRQQAAPPASAPEVAVMTVKPERVVLTSELPGRTSAMLVAEIRPQVSGLIQKRLFTEGSQVKEGQLLYEIDPAPYQAAYNSAVAALGSANEAVDRAQAALAASKAALQRHHAIKKLAKANLQRYENLLKTHAVSAMQHDQAVSELDVAESGLKVGEAQVDSDQQAIEGAQAAVKQAEAAVASAKINLEYTKITAPIAGRIGRSNVTVGAIVTAYQPTALATIQQMDPIYVDVPQSTVELNRLKRNLANGHLEENGSDSVKIVLEDGTAYAQEGSLKFRDVTVDPTTGSVILRIVVPNPDKILLPGMFVRAVVEEGVNQKAILIPQQAVSRDPKGNPVTHLVDAAGKVKQQQISTDRALGDKWLVSNGLKEGDRVIVEGIQGVMMSPPGTSFKTVPFGSKSSNAAKPATTTQTATR